MNIIISGYGRMGKEVEKICINRGHNIINIIDNNDQWTQIKDIDNSTVVIDFSLPDVAVDNILKCFNLGIPIVTGTTGWHDQLNKISNECEQSGGTLFFAPNFSIGVNIFFRVNEYLAKVMNGLEDYQIQIDETHHIHKLDAPSGTAIAAAIGIIQNIDRKSEWSLDKEKDGALPIYAHRKGEVTGTHEVIYSSDIDNISLKHEAKNRSGFALGAVMAAEFISGKKGVFSMNELIDSILK